MLIISRSELHYTTSGIVTPIDGRLVHRLREDYFNALHVSSTCAYHQKVKIALHSLWYHQTYRWPSGAQVERGLFHASTCFEHMCSPSGGQIPLHKFRYHQTYRWPSGAQVERGLFQASTCFEHMCSSSGGQNCITQPVVSLDL